MNANVGNDIKVTSEKIIKQQGITDNILKELSIIGDTSKELYEKTTQELMISIINKRQLFSDDFLFLCWGMECRDNKDPLQSELWNAIKTQCNKIIQNGTKRDWYWLKKVLLPSTVMFPMRSLRSLRALRISLFLKYFH